MKQKRDTRTCLVFISILVALGLCGWSFQRSEQYRNELATLANQTYEIQWRSTQIREKLIRLDAYIRTAISEIKADPDLALSIKLAEINVRQVLALSYVNVVLSAADVASLNRIGAILENRIAPLINSGHGYQEAYNYLQEAEYLSYQVTGATVAHSATINQAAQINLDASQNRLIFAVSLALLTIGYMAIKQSHSFACKRDNHLRSFSSLFAHMTHTRIAALRLFLQQQKVNEPIDVRMLEAARNASSELEAINRCLLNIADVRRQYVTNTVEHSLRHLRSQRKSCVCIAIDPKAALLPVPAIELQMILDELIQNAETAVEGQSNAKITVSGKAERSWLIGRVKLTFEVIDNGKGMDDKALNKAMSPFFSTKAGSHLGLGLTSCEQMIKALAGSISLTSREQKGTTVRISFPVRRTDRVRLAMGRFGLRP